MKFNERLANMSTNHKAMIANRLIRKVYIGESDLGDLDFATFVKEYEAHPEVRCFCGGVWRAFGIQDMRKVTDWLPGIGLWINPMKCESEIDSTIKYYTHKILNHE